MGFGLVILLMPTDLNLYLLVVLLHALYFRLQDDQLLPDLRCL